MAESTVSVRRFDHFAVLAVECLRAQAVVIGRLCHAPRVVIGRRTEGNDAAGRGDDGIQVGTRTNDIDVDPEQLFGFFDAAGVVIDRMSPGDLRRISIFGERTSAVDRTPRLVVDSARNQQHGVAFFIGRLAARFDRQSTFVVNRFRRPAVGIDLPVRPAKRIILGTATLFGIAVGGRPGLCS